MKDVIQEVDHILSQDRVGYQNLHAFPGEFIQNAQGFELRSIGQAINENVIRQYMVRIFSLMWSRSRVFWLAARFAPVLSGQFEVVLFPKPPAATKTQASYNRNPPISITRVAARGCAYLLQPLSFLCRTLQFIAPNRPGIA